MPSMYATERGGLIAAAMVATATGILLASPTFDDPDLWGHLAFGEQMIRSGTIPRYDTYSYLTDGAAWTNHEWLFEVLMAATYRTGGLHALPWLKAAFLVALGTLLISHLYRSGVTLLAAALSTFLAMALIWPWISVVRPQLASYAAFAALLWLLESPRTSARLRAAQVAMLFVAWANLHGGFALGVVCLATWLLGHTLASSSDPASRRGLRALALLPAVALAASLVNPYGVALWSFLVTAAAPRPEILEWRPLPALSWSGFLWAVIVLLSLFARKSREQLSQLGVFALLVVLPWFAVRHLPFLVLGFFFLMLPRLGSPAPLRSLRALHTAAVVVAAIVAAVVGVRRIAHMDVDYAALPVNAVSLLAGTGRSANVAVEFNWGQYLLWCGEGRLRVSVDGRRETVYSPRVYGEALAFLDGRSVTDTVLRDADFVLVNRDGPAHAQLSGNPDWQSLYSDARSTLWRRLNSPVAATIDASPLQREFTPNRVGCGVIQQ